jgi:hypothetical protein
MRMASSERAAASSSTLNKLARNLRDAGIPVPTSRCPPSHADILAAIRAHCFDFVVASFHRGNDRITVALPTTVLQWLKEDANRRFPILHAEIVKAAYRGRASIYALSWDSREFVLLKDGSPVEDFELQEDSEE